LVGLASSCGWAPSLGALFQKGLEGRRIARGQSLLGQGCQPRILGVQPSGGFLGGKLLRFGRCRVGDRRHFAGPGRRGILKGLRRAQKRWGSDEPEKDEAGGGTQDSQAAPQQQPAPGHCNTRLAGKFAEPAVGLRENAFLGRPQGFLVQAFRGGPEEAHRLCLLIQPRGGLVAGQALEGLVGRKGPGAS